MKFTLLPILPRTAILMAMLLVAACSKQKPLPEPPKPDQTAVEPAESLPALPTPIDQPADDAAARRAPDMGDPDKGDPDMSERAVGDSAAADTGLPTSPPPDSPPSLPMPATSDTAAEDSPPVESPADVLEELGYVSPSRQVAEALAAPPGGVRISRDSLLWIDPNNRQVIADGYVAQQQAYLEMFACPAETKEHEAVVAVVAKSSEMHAALLAIGAEPGKTVQFEPEYVPASGPKIRIWVMWRDDEGEVQVIDARKWVRRYGTEESLDRDWVFAGSTWWKDPTDGHEYYQADSGEMICVSNFNTALLDLPIESSQSTGALQFEVFTERVPPRGTPVRLVLQQLASADDDLPPPDPALMPLRTAADPEAPATPAEPADASTLPLGKPPTVASATAKADSADGETADLSQGLIAHWPLAGDAVDAISGHAATPRGEGVELNAIAAAFYGSGSWLEVAADQAPKLGTGDFTLAMRVRCDDATDRATGDLISWYDPDRRRGFHLTLKSASGVTTNQPHHGHLQFGIDDDRASSWRPCGRPGDALLAFALAVHDGALYAGTCEPGGDQSGRVYRYDGDDRWVDCGAPDGSNSVTALAVHRGQLYAGTGKYRLAGSSLPESENETLGGGVFRYDGEQRWVDCGRLPETEAVGGLVVFRDRLHASSLYRPAGFFRYEPDAADDASDDTATWVSLAVPQGTDPETGEPRDLRVEALSVFEGHLYGSSYDGGHVHRYDGESWTDCGRLGDNTQTYSFAQYEGRLLVGTWPSGRVYRFEAIDDWTDVGRLGEELEVMGMLVHNGRLFAGTLPLAEVHVYDGKASWTRLTQLDATPDVRYRRAWTMAEHAGELFCSTLPSGQIFAYSQGHQIALGKPLSAGWHDIAATRAAGRLTLYVDGQPVAESDGNSADYDLDVTTSLRIGAGIHGTLNGELADLRIYDRALSANQIRRLAN